MLKTFTFILVVFVLSASGASAAGKKKGWDTVLKPGDKVCIYDIAMSDPLVDKTSTSFKYYYRSPLGEQNSRYQLRPAARDLVLRIVWPGLTIDGTPDRNGEFWFSGSLLVISGGYRPGLDKNYLIERGENTLVVEKNRSWIMDWQVLHFKQVRLKKKKMIRGCKRKYPIY